MERKCNCRGCGRSFVELGKHLGKKPECAAVYAVADIALPKISDRQRDAEKKKTGEDIYAAELRAHVFEDVAEWYFFRYFGATRMTAIVSAMKRWTAFALKETEPELQHLLGQASGPVMELLAKRLQFFDGLETEAQVKSYARTRRPVLKPMENQVGPGADDRAYGIDIAEWITELCRHDPEARKEIVEKSELWKSGAKLKKPDVLRSFDDASTFRESAFAQPEPPAPEGVLLPHPACLVSLPISNLVSRLVSRFASRFVCRDTNPPGGSSAMRVAPPLTCNNVMRVRGSNPAGGLSEQHLRHVCPRPR